MMKRAWITAASLLAIWSSAASSAVFDIPDGDVQALNDAILAANGNGEGDVINLAPAGRYSPENFPDGDEGCDASSRGTLLSIMSRIIINGRGAVIDGIRNFHRPFCVDVAGDLTLTDLRLTDFVNEGPLEGSNTVGGVMIIRGKAQLQNVTIDKVVADAFNGLSLGGAIFNDTTGMLQLQNVTITDVTIVPAFPGGGRGALASSGEMTVINSILTGNSGGTATQGNSGGTAGIWVNGATTLVNTIVAGNDGDDCAFVGTGAKLISLGHNIDGDGTCGLDQPTDQPETDPELGTFGDHGGPIPTIALEPDSPAIGAAEDLHCPPVDARGFVRATGPRFDCDIGPFQLDAKAHDIEPALTASWFFLPQSGHGFNVEVLGPDRNQVLAYWYTYDAEGNPIWLQGVGDIQGNRSAMALYRYEGMRFGEFDPGTKEAHVWGTLSLYFRSCQRGAATWQPLDPALPAGGIPLSRLSIVQGLDCGG